ncbi:MAG: hypothetical protein DWQ49_03855 [Bacteroidetes bacterium]|nr:MAG: hypothetical protein DWQ49_03855 [Bacteroidota bacterium]
MKKTIRKCRKCGKEFRAVLDVQYCSGQCERLAANPVAKHNYNRPATHKPKKGKGSYNRRKHNRVVWNLEKEG